MKTQQIVIAGLVALVFAGAGFFAGMKYQQSTQPGFAGRMGNFNQIGANNQNRMMNGFRPVNGEITASDSKSITVKMNDGSSRIVLLSNSTTINKSAEATLADLKVGVIVAAFGQTNTDGSVTATSIQLNPILRNQNQTPVKTQ